jgi:hypothetical protein
VTRNGREYFVAPMTLIVPGVLNGSLGPLYYPPDETARAAPDWNDVPIVVYHPVRNGRPVPGKDLNVLAGSKIGRVYNAHFTDRLKAEGWFNCEDTRRVDPRVYEALEEGRRVELSTGLYTKNDPAPAGSEVNGQPYTHVARNHKPEHLAVLPDQRGACSNEDGCGVLVNQKGEPMAIKDFSNAILRGLTVLGGGVPGGSGPVLPDPTKSAEPAQPAQPTVNEPSHSDVSFALHQQLAERFVKTRPGDGPTSPEDSLFVLEVYDKDVVFVRGEKTWKLGYTKDNKANTVTLSDAEPEEVVKVTQYKPVDNSTGDQPMAGKLNDVQRRQYAETLATNCGCGSSGGARNQQVEDFLKLSDDTLAALAERQQALTHNHNQGIAQPDGSRQVFNDKLGRWEVYYPPVVNQGGQQGNQAPPPPPANNPQALPSANPPAPTNNGSGQIPLATPVVPVPVKPTNQGEWLALMPPDAQAIWNSAVQVHEEKKAELIGRLTANASEPYKTQITEIYKGMGLPQLQALAAALPPAHESPPYQAPAYTAPAQNYFTGAGGAPAQAVTNAEEPLLQPTYQWGPNK